MQLRIYIIFGLILFAHLVVQPLPLRAEIGQAYYGTGLGADSLANFVVGTKDNYSVDLRFKAIKAGQMVSFRYYNVFALDRPGYQYGTGGTIRIELRTDDGSSNHLPSGTSLTKGTIYGAVAAGLFPLVTLDSAANIEKDKFYHLVFTNVDADPANNWGSVNTIRFVTASVPKQPSLEDDRYQVFSRNGTNAWISRNNVTPILEVRYADASVQGIGYMDVIASETKDISGTSAVREVFTVSGTSRVISGGAIRLLKASGSSNLKASLRDATQKLIAEASIPADAISFEKNWVSFSFNGNVLLETQKTYYFSLHTPQDSKFSTYPLQEGSGYGFLAPTFFADGYAQYTIDGTSWFEWRGPGRKDFDLQFYFKEPDTSDNVPPLPPTNLHILE